MADDTSDLAKVAKKSNDTYALLSQLTLAHEMLKMYVQESFNECIKKIADSNLQTSTKDAEHSEGIKKAKQDLNAFKSETQTRHKLASVEIKELKDLFTQVVNENHDLKDQLSNIDKKIYALHTTSNLAVNSNLEKMRKDLNEKIAKLPIPTDFVTSEKAKDQIEEKLEPTRREASSATNNIRALEMRMMLVEKKVESALAHLKTLGQK